MTSDRSRILSPKSLLDFTDPDQFDIVDHHGEDNPTFSPDELGLELPTTTTTTAADLLDVSFHTDSSTISISYRPNTMTSTEPLTIEGTGDGSDEEVAAHVSNTDDPTISVLTFRSWFLGLLFTCLLSFVNQFFWYRTSPLFVGTLVAQLLTYPLGKLMAKLLPTRKFRIFRWTFTLNPGPFTIKEHCIITAMANATCVR